MSRKPSMEAPMIDYEEVIHQLIGRAVINGSEEFHDPKFALIENVTVSDDYLNDLYTDLQTKYECISHLKHGGIGEFDFLNKKWNDVVSLIAWCIRCLGDWTDTDLTSLNKITVILNVTCFLDKEGCFWKSLQKRDIPLSKSLLDHSQLQLSNLRCEFKVDDTDNVPIHEIESLEKFLSAISNKNWQDISDLWKIFNNRPLFSSENVQRLQMLDYFEPMLLGPAFKDTNDIPILMHVMHYLRVETAFRIGFETTNDYLEFASVHSTLNTPKGNAVLNDTETAALSSILSKISNDEIKFNSWVNIFNKYPPHYSNIPIALGKVLAINATDENIGAYVKSISLNNHTDNESRKIISECLFEFTKSASPTRRKKLWNNAHEYWAEWNFGEKESNNYMFNIVFSNLDFAIIGYYKECISDYERVEVKKKIINNMQSLENRWHHSSSAATAYWYRNLSFYQVIEHADKATEQADTWLLLESYYIPEQFHENKYTEMIVK